MALDCFVALPRNDDLAAKIDEVIRFKSRRRAMTTMYKLLSPFLALALSLAACGYAGAQPYPNHPIKMIVPFAPGGADVIARLVGDQITAALGQPVVHENRPGAGGVTGTKSIVTAAPDGYTITLASPGPITVAPAVNKNADYNPIRELAPVALIATSPIVLVVNPNVPVKTVKELVAYANANPGKANYASVGFGTSPHLLGELLKQKTGAKIVHVPYRGSSPALVDLLSNQVQFLFDNLRNVHTFISSGKLRALAVTSETRSPALPDVPTMKEAGVDGFVDVYWNGVLAPGGTPSDIVGKLNAVINAGLNTPVMKENLTKLDMQPKPATPAEFAAFIKAGLQKWSDIAGKL
jgi:tripartite-type tricarboxylate transporter receptor subunit TctC